MGKRSSNTDAETKFRSTFPTALQPNSVLCHLVDEVYGTRTITHTHTHTHTHPVGFLRTNNQLVAETATYTTTRTTTTTTTTTISTTTMRRD